MASDINTEKYLDPKTLDRIKRIDVRARLVVEGFITGKHRSPYNGFAIEFAAHREYAPGDDLRRWQSVHGGRVLSFQWQLWSGDVYRGDLRRRQPLHFHRL